MEGGGREERGERGGGRREGEGREEGEERRGRGRKGREGGGERWLVSEEEGRVILEPGSLGSLPVGYVQAGNQPLSTGTEIHWHTQTLLGRVEGRSLLDHPGNRAGWHGNHAGRVMAVLHKSGPVKRTTFQLEPTNL